MAEGQVQHLVREVDSLAVATEQLHHEVEQLLVDIREIGTVEHLFMVTRHLSLSPSLSFSLSLSQT